MPFRNLWSLNSGEVLAAEAALKNIPGIDVYFPVRDVGVDLLVVRGKRHCAIQVKESRHYQEKKWQGSWHQVSDANVNPPPGSKKKAPDFFVFVTYEPDCSGGKRPGFKPRYIIVPISELRRRLGSKRASKGKYSYDFSIDGSDVYDVREEYAKDATPATTYSAFLDAWPLIEKCVRSRSGGPR
jgi:hypothetical protein